MSFPELLKADNVIPVSKNVLAGIELIQDFREFLKERASLEREYGARLEAMSKKYRSRRAMGLGSLAFNNDPFAPQHGRTASADIGSISTSATGANSLGLDPEQSTLLKAISCIFDKTEKIALERSNYADRINEILVLLKVLSTRTEDLRKKAVDANKRLLEDYETAIEDKERARVQYEESCIEVQSSIIKQDRIQDPKSLDKITRQYFHEVIDRNNNKNLYILAVHVANKLQAKHFDKDIPDLLDHFQTLNESWIVGLKNLLTQLERLELECTSESKDRIEEKLAAICKVDYKVETSLVSSSHTSTWNRPSKCEFEVFIGFEEDEKLIDEEASKVFLFNKLRKSQAQLQELNNNITLKSKELDGLGSLYTAYFENPTLGDSNEIRENIFELWKELAFLRNTQLSRQTESDLILESMGDLPPGQIHEFKAASFTIPTTCDYCESTIWGLSRHGATCKECGYNCHAKCEFKAPPNCTLAKGGSKAGKRPHIDFSTLSAKTETFLKPSARTSLPAEFTKAGEESEAPIAIAQAPTAVALYDYDAADDAELTIRENQILEILVADDGSGWITARLGGKTGLVPAAYVSITDKAIAPPANSLMAEAIYDFDAQADTDLTIRTGELIEITNQEVSEGWWEGKLNGRIGQFPANYVKIV